MVAQIDEEKPAMVAQTMHPAGKADGLADVLFAKLAASMGAIGVNGLGMGPWRRQGGGFASAAEQRMGRPPLSRRAQGLTRRNDGLVSLVSPLSDN